MTSFNNSFEGGSSGTTITVPNSGGASGDTLGAVVSTPAYDNTRAAHGSLSAKIAPASGAAMSFALGSAASGWGATQLATRAYFYFTANPTTTFTLLRANQSTSGSVFSLDLNTTGTVTLRTNDGTTTTARWTSTGTIPLNSWFRVEIRVICSATVGQVIAAFYAGDSTTTIDTFTSPASYNIVPAGVASVNFGKYGTDTSATPFWIDDIAVNNATTSFIGPYTTPLATPVVTLGATTNPSTVGGSDGIQIVTWPAVSGAIGYDAWIATTLTPGQNDFTLVASDVTSPYSFTGLSAGSKAFGIQAKA